VRTPCYLDSVVVDGLQDGAGLEDGYIKGNGKALEVVQRQLLDCH
jgi:hypothetical protein